jgi:plasmid stability protein
VRTTIRIDDDLYRAVKERAARSGRTIAAVLEDAVRAGLSPAPAWEGAPSRYTVPVTGSGGLVAGVDLSSNAVVQEALDRDAPLDALR